MCRRLPTLRNRNRGGSDPPLRPRSRFLAYPTGSLRPADRVTRLARRRPACCGTPQSSRRRGVSFPRKPAFREVGDDRHRTVVDATLSVAAHRLPGVATFGDVAAAERTAHAIQQKLDGLDEAFLLERSIAIETYDRHAERLAKELTLARIAKHSTELEELDAEGILAFAERVLPAPQICGSRRRSSSGSGSNNCSSGGNDLRRPAVCWNRRNRTGLQLLAGDFGRR